MVNLALTGCERYSGLAQPELEISHLTCKGGMEEEFGPQRKATTLPLATCLARAKGGWTDGVEAKGEDGGCSAGKGDGLIAPAADGTTAEEMPANDDDAEGAANQPTTLKLGHDRKLDA